MKSVMEVILSTIEEDHKKMRKLEEGLNYKLGRKAELERQIRVGIDAQKELFELQCHLVENMKEYLTELG